MYKLFFIACLFVCALGSGMYSYFPPCAYHLKVSQSNADGDYYGIRVEKNTFSAYIMKNISADGSYDLIRCDVRDAEGHCYASFYRANDQENPCKHEWVYDGDANRHLIFDDSRLIYDGEKYPQPVKCVNGTDGCQKYCDYYNEEDCVIVDARGFYVQRNGVNFVLIDSSFDMNIFKDDKCNDTVSAPHKLCETVKTITPKIPDCSFHVKVNNSFGSKEYFGVKPQDSYNTVYLKTIEGEDYSLCRRDIPFGKASYIKNVKNGQCSDDYGSRCDYVSWPSDVKYDSASYPKDVKCPDGSSGCKMYCLDSTEYECATFDVSGYLVKKGKDEVWTFYPEPPMTVFEDDTCEDPKQHLAAPVDICTTQKLFNPKIVENCTFHLSLELFDRRRVIHHFDLSGVMDGDKYVAVKYVYVGEENYSYIVRLDIPNDKGEYFVVYNGPDGCSEDYMDYDDLEGEFIDYLPEPFVYDSSKYPVPAKCPDGSDGCSQYCLVPSSCIIADAAGHVVQAGELVNYTYYAAPSVDEFEVDTCEDPKRHIPAPVDVCAPKELLNPKIVEGCTFHLSLELLDRRRVIHYFDLSGVMDGDKYVALKFVYQNYSFVTRLDITNDKGEYFVVYNGADGCSEGYMDDDYLEGNFFDYLPEPFEYDSSKYPVPTKCPDGSDGCSKYCSVPTDCVIADAAGHIVQAGKALVNYTYYAAPSVDEFEVDTCEGVHHPLSIVCGGSQSSTSEPSNSSALVSSASMVKSIFTFVSILIIVALL